MVQLIVRILAPTNKRKEIVEVLKYMKGPTESALGCRGCWVFSETDNHDAITYMMRWDEREQLEVHLKGERFRMLLPYIEMSLERPEVEVNLVDPLGGIDLLVTMMDSGQSTRSS